MSSRPHPSRSSSVTPRPDANWAVAGREPSLEEALADPVVQAVMRRDGIAAAQLRLLAAVFRARHAASACCRCAA